MIVSVPIHAKRLRDRWDRERDSFGELLNNELSVKENSEEFSPRSIEERFVQCIWLEQLIKTDGLVTASNKAVEIIEPGRWNHGRGPDFQNARIKIAGQELAGDIEIHTESSGWKNHKHDTDFEYNRVILHVCLCASDDRPYETKQNNQRLERLVLENQLEPDFDSIRKTLNPDDYPFAKSVEYGVCHKQFINLEPKKLHQFFVTAGKNRIEDKIERFRQQLMSSSLDQVIYQAIMISSGYKGNKPLYFLLSKRVPVAELFDYFQDCKSSQERIDLTVSLLINTASLYPVDQELENENQEFASRLNRVWSSYRNYFSDRIMPPTKRWYAGMRPPGFPMRRFTAVAYLLERFYQEKLFDKIVHMIDLEAPIEGTDKDWKKFFKQLLEKLTVIDPDHFFARHYTLHGKEISPQALLGEPAAKVMLFNVIFPLVILHARSEKNKQLEDKVWSALNVFPNLPDNSITKMMVRRLFADSGFDKSLKKREITKQALYKIFEDCCNWNEQTCETCTFFRSPLADKLE